MYLISFHWKLKGSETKPGRSKAQDHCHLFHDGVPVVHWVSHGSLVCGNNTGRTRRRYAWYKSDSVIKIQIRDI